MNGVKLKIMDESEDEGDNAEEEDVDDDGGLGTSKSASPLAKKAKRDMDASDNCDLFLFFLFLLSVLKSFRLFPAENSTDSQADQVGEWRRKLQKVFLSNRSVPKAEVRPSLYHNRYIV